MLSVFFRKTLFFKVSHTFSEVCTASIATPPVFCYTVGNFRAENARIFERIHVMRRNLILAVVLLLSACLTACGKNTTKDPAGDATPTATATPTEIPFTVDASARQVTFDVEGTHQTIDGFGAGFTWYSEMIFSLGKRETVLDLLFKDAGFTILRFKNEYGYGTQKFDSGATFNALYYKAAQKRADERGEKVTVLYSSWSPPASLKSNNRIEGYGTLKRGDDGNYMYDEFAQWWKDSVDAYRGYGIPVDYVSIQNECDFQASYDGCEFDSQETDSLASYPKAYLATYRLFRDSFGDDAPLMIGPETMTVASTTLRSYLRAIISEEPDSVAAVAHHLYLGGESSDDPNTCAPDSFLMNFKGVSSLAKDYGIRKWQTEFYRGTALQTANVINNSLIYENVNAYIFWGGVWAGQVTDGMDSGNLINVGRQFRDGMCPDGFMATGNYYAMRHFSEFIRPGYVRIDVKLSDATDVRSSAYKNDDGSVIVLVLLNNGTEPAKVQLPLENYTITNSKCYQSVFTEGYTAAMMYNDLGALDTNRTVTLPGESATTIVLYGKTK